jgi:hypothetical protein
MKNWKPLLAACIIFLSGAVLGVAGTRLYVQRAVLRTVAGDMAQVEGLIMGRLDDKLDLSDEQRRELRPILARALDELSAIRQESRPKADAAIDRAVADMKPRLTPEQGEALSAMAARFRAARAARAAPSDASRE